jgi:hypothetical protein
VKGSLEGKFFSIGYFLMALLFQIIVCGALQQLAQAGEWESRVNEKGQKVQELKIQAPTMTEEDQYGYTMPEQYRCDSCKVVAYHLEEALKRKELKSRRLTEWEIQELFDDTCHTGFKGYGLSHVNGESVLSGPAMKRENLEPGMGAIQMGGETWEKRLGEICRKFVYDKIGEDELYEHFRKHHKVSEDLCFQKTRDCKRIRHGPEPVPKVDVGEESHTGKKDDNQKKSKTSPSNETADIELGTFMSKLAAKHGVAKTDYTKKRSFEEWEKLLTEAGDRVKRNRDVLEV